LISNIKGENP